MYLNYTINRTFYNIRRVFVIKKIIEEKQSRRAGTDYVALYNARKKVDIMPMCSKKHRAKKQNTSNILPLYLYLQKSPQNKVEQYKLKNIISPIYLHYVQDSRKSIEQSRTVAEG